MNLMKGGTNSCGCLRKEIVRTKNTTHNLSSHRLHCIWFSMVQRCTNETTNSFFSYGGRGISICDDWLEFLNFYNWALSNGYRDELTIERVNNNGNYEPNNCVWATKTQQARNKRNVPLFTYKGESKSGAEWCELYNIHPETFRYRLKRGWEFEDALTKPVHKRNLVRNEDSLTIK
jgi:hypothetical protein